MILINRDLLEPAPHQGLVKLRQSGGLVADKILKLVDAAKLLVSCGGVYSSLLP